MHYLHSSEDNALKICKFHCYYKWRSRQIYNSDLASFNSKYKMQTFSFSVGLKVYLFFPALLLGSFSLEVFCTQRRQVKSGEWYVTVLQRPKNFPEKRIFCVLKPTALEALECWDSIVSTLRFFAHMEISKEQG